MCCTSHRQFTSFALDFIPTQYVPIMMESTLAVCLIVAVTYIGSMSTSIDARATQFSGTGHRVWRVEEAKPVDEPIEVSTAFQFVAPISFSYFPLQFQ